MVDATCNNLFLPCSSYLEFASFDDIDMIGLLILLVDYLVSKEALFCKRQDNPLDLSFSPMSQKWEILEKGDPLLKGLLLNFHQNFLVVGDAQNG